jgi:hypothetical protein
MNQIQKAASLMGKLNKGVPKTLTDEERQRRSQRLAEARKKRWPKKRWPKK